MCERECVSPWEWNLNLTKRKIHKAIKNKMKILKQLLSDTCAKSYARKQNILKHFINFHLILHAVLYPLFTSVYNVPGFSGLV